jgi:hypothetical protein
MSSASLYPPRGQSLGMSGPPPPGSFSSELRSTTSRAETLRPDFARQDSNYGNDDDGEDARSVSEKRQQEITREIEKETKIKEGSENMLEALNSKNAKQFKEQKLRVEAELNTSNRKLAELRQGLEMEIQRAKESQMAGEGRLSFLFGNAIGGSGAGAGAGVGGRPASRQTYLTGTGEDVYNELEEEQEAESPTYVLSEILQALEAEGMGPEYYVGYANRLVELFKRNPTLKYDLVWSIFGLRMQTLLLSDSREVVAAGYRVLRYSITDRRSLRVIRELHTDYLVILSLVKEGKASVEREQALKFVRAFLDVKDGIQEISKAVIRIIVAVAEHSDDRLRNIAILTLAEILIRDPAKLVEAGGMGTLTDALGDGNYRAAQSLVGAFLFLLDTPRRRKFLRSGHELEMPLATFTESPVGHVHEEKLKASGKVISALMRSWPGLITFSMNDFLAIRSLVASMYIPLVHVRHQLLDLIIDVLRIKSPSWGSSFVAGRRLTTYARVTNLKTQTPSLDIETEEETDQRNLVEHFTAVVLGVFLHAGLLEALLHAEEDALSLPLKRKTTLVLGEVLKAANELLPNQWSAKLQVLPTLVRAATKIDIDTRFLAMGTIYQIDSVNRTLYRSDPSSAVASSSSSRSTANNTTEEAMKQSSESAAKAQQGMQMDETQFRNLMLDTGCLSTSNWTKWRWDLIQNLIDGPLRNPKRLDEAMRSTKLLHRLLGFYRPFKYRFADVKNTKPNQRYVRIGCALFQCLLVNIEGVRYLAEDKVIRQLAECLSHFDRMSGLTSETPMFTESRMNETLTGGYFQLLGALTKESRGLQILERWRIFNMFYHIVELRDRDDLVKMLLGSMDYNLDSHLRIILSKAMTTGSKSIRIFATRVLRRYATRTTSDDRTVEWAIRLLVTQLYDPEIEVCEIAIKILEESCKQIHSLEYIVKCRPALDHLGEIGAPLLLRFLSTSVGYKYLDELDYITREMDDWFLGRNDSYVALIEASLARALADIPDKTSNNTQQQTGGASGFDDTLPPETLDYGMVPPHFYRELTRTREGCELLEAKGHFDEFAAAIKDWGMEEEDAEIILKVKGCLWAVGNVGSMELGARFLEQSDVVRHIVAIAERSQVMTMRGTAFFALGLASRSLHGQEILVEYGWDGTTNMRGESLGFCVPLEFGKLFAVRPWKAPYAMGSTGTFAKKPELGAIDERDDPIEARILKSVTDLGNTVLAKKAAGDLHRYVFLLSLTVKLVRFELKGRRANVRMCSIKAKNPLRFQRTSLFLRVLHILELHHFRLPVCRFVIDLFDKKVMRRIVLEEEIDEPTDDEDQGLFDDEDGGEGNRMSRVMSSRSQALTDVTDEDEEDAELFGDGDGGEGGSEKFESLPTEDDVDAEFGMRRRGEDMNGTAILRGNG